MYIYIFFFDFSLFFTVELMSKYIVQLINVLFLMHVAKFPLILTRYLSRGILSFTISLSFKMLFFVFLFVELLMCIKFLSNFNYIHLYISSM